ncbi:MAG: recombinase family protein [Pseudomonadota bacterium]
MILGYIRVSTREQNVGRQEDALRAVCDDVVMEKLSAVADKRPGFDAALARLERGDTFCVLDLDRAFRSTVDAITVADQLKERGINFRVLNSPIDTTTEFGEVVFTILAALAQAERKTASRRTREGLEAARKRGKHVGRPRKLSAAQVELARRSIGDGNETVTAMAEILGVDRKTLRRALDRS